MEKSKATYDGSDLLKLICSMLIIFLHINPFPYNSFLRFFTRSIANIGVPIFFMLSGFFFFSKIYKAPESDHKNVLKNYLIRLLCLLAFWTTPYFIIYDLPWIIKGNVFLNALEYLKHVLLGGPGYFLWYIVSLIFATIYCYALKNTKLYISIPTVSLLFVVGCIGTSYTFLLDNTFLSNCLQLYNNTFVTMRNGLFFGLPCVFTGATIAKNKGALLNLKKSIICFFISVALVVLELYALRNNLMEARNMQVSIIVLAFACVLLSINVKINLGKYSAIIRKLSFLIYVIHPLYIRIILLLLPINETIEYYWYLWYWLQIPCILAATIITGMFIIKLSKKVAFLKKAM